MTRLACAVGVLAAAALACAEGADTDTFRPLQVGDPAPAYSTAALGGEPISLEDLRGQVVLLNVWATWCIPCREEMPALQKLHSDLSERGLVILGVSVDRPGAAEEVARYVEEGGIEFRIALDWAGEVQRVFRTIGVPESFLIDRDGRILQRWIGQFDPGASDVRALVDGALSGR